MLAVANRKRKVPNEEHSLSSKRKIKSRQMDTNMSDCSDDESAIESSTITVQFTSEAEDSNESLPIITGFPINTTKNILQKNLSNLLNQDENEIPYSFFIEDKEITKDIGELLDEKFSAEKTLVIKYQAQAVFKVHAVNRCTSSLPGHAEPVLCASFSPDGRFLASGSGDKTVRFWDVNTETPHFTARGHQHHVLVTAWSPDGNRLASGCKKGEMRIWNPSSGQQVGRTLSNQPISRINDLCWQPSHLCDMGISRKVASASENGTVAIWNVYSGTRFPVLNGHTKNVKSLRWSGEGGQEGEGYIYSASDDMTIKIWNAANGVLWKTLDGHGHFVRTLSLNTDYVIRTGGNEPKNLMRNKPEYVEDAERRERAAERYSSCLKNVGVERLVSGSDDFTLILWTPQTSDKKGVRMTGHKQLVNEVKFSPDSRLIISASFDKSIRLWNGVTGSYICTFLGHVQGVYQMAWAADSRFFVSGSRDSTLKVWSISSKRLEKDIPGHADEVYALDWSPDGERVVSGGKDKILKIYRN